LMRADLLRAPIMGGERLGVALSRYASRYTQDTMVLVQYIGLPLTAYSASGSAPISFETRWLMKMAQDAARKNAGIFLVHLHEHRGKPWFSPIDMETNRTIVQPLALIDQTSPTGALVLSLDDAAAVVGRSDGLVAISVRQVATT